jgi:hypothetical protein
VQHKFLLRFIKQEMEAQKIAFKNNEEFFRLFLPDEPWESYRSNMSNWLSLGEEDGTIRKKLFISAINEKLGLTPEIWKASEVYQKEAVREGIQKFKVLLREDAEMFSWLEEEGMNEEHERFLLFVQDALVDEIEKALEEHQPLFKKSAKNQSFLEQFFNHMYERGEYEFVYKKIFPSLLDSYDNTIKSRKADIYASLPQPMYKEAFEILNSIKGENRNETIDLRTSAISNIRREKLSSKVLSKEELKILLHRLIKCYKKIYTPKQEYSYYPGINLAYMVAMVGYIFPDEVEDLTEGYTLTQIYNDVKSSLEKGISSELKEERYYAGVSKIEFQLLLGQQGIARDLELFLEEIQPLIHQVNQTQRQMGLFFLDVIEVFSPQSLVRLRNFESALSILDAYVEVF